MRQTSTSDRSLNQPAPKAFRRGYTFALRVALAAAVMGLLPTPGLAQINSNQATVNLNAVLAESLTLTASPSTVNFTLASGAAATGSAPVSITTSWVLGVNRATVKLFGWFTTPTAALTDGGSPANNIASTYVLGQVATGIPTSYTPFTQSNTLGTASGGLALFSQSLTALNRASSRTDSLALKIDLTSLPQLPAGSYTGTLTLQAQAL